MGDRVLDDLGRSISGQYTGPLRPGESWTGTWRAVIYNSSARCFVLTEATVELQDGSKFTYRGAGLANIMSASNVCAPLVRFERRTRRPRHELRLVRCCVNAA